MITPTALRQPLSLRMTSAGFLVIWCLLASFPLFWIMVMSFKEPVDSFASNPLAVVFGPETRANGKGLSILDIAAGLVVLWYTVRLAVRKLPGAGPALRAVGLDLARLDRRLAPVRTGIRHRLLHRPAADPGYGERLHRTLRRADHRTHDRALPGGVVENEFYRNFINSLIVTTGVVTVSLTVGTLAGYGLARSASNIAFWLLIIALVFRALPHSVLVAGYLPVFISSAEFLEPILGEAAPTLYGKPWAVIAVLVSINQPFTIWMLRSFFQNIPRTWTRRRGSTAARTSRPSAG